MKLDLNKAAIAKAPQRKKWVKPSVQVANIKEMTQGRLLSQSDGPSNGKS